MNVVIQPVSPSPGVTLFALLQPPFEQELYLNFYFCSKATNKFLERIFLRRSELAGTQGNHFSNKAVALWNGNKLGIK